ncbi:MAG: glycogen/starch/alpha-glucan phosphorylase [Clostridium perfringens]|nr:glycogen/starch/alpha-glucan phosphorylase [Clostridium perfringens]
MNKETIRTGMERYLKIKYRRTLETAKDFELFNALSLTLLENIIDDWDNTDEVYKNVKNAYYFSAEFLMGRALGNNLINLGVYDNVKEILDEFGLNLNVIEEIEEDAGLGNGGLGRLAACFMDSGATLEVPLTGYGIRYSNGLFKQEFKDGNQNESADSWLKYGDPWSIRRDDESTLVEFADMTVRAVPYDTPIIGYKSKNINTLRLWKCEPLEEFNFDLYNSQQYSEALDLKNKADNISRVLYPNDTGRSGKVLRLRQQYVLVSASLKDIIRKYKEVHGTITEDFASFNAIQLNDTHPVLGIPELIRILVDEEGLEFHTALNICKKTFAYTNHTILAEALEKWDAELFRCLFPRILEIINIINSVFITELKSKGYNDHQINEFSIVNNFNGQVRMANLAISVGFAVNGVAKLHTDILKNLELNNWYKLYPEKFQNKTNGITPRRWLRLCNRELSELITELLGDESWVKDLDKLSNLKKFSDDKVVLERFLDIKLTKKKQLAEFIKENEGLDIDPTSLFDIQIKRLHEYKRQLLNSFYILDLYFRLKENPNLDIPKCTFIFGAKAFPGYRRAKSIVKFTNDIANLVNNDKDLNGKLKVVFVKNYRVSYAEKLCPAADISKQISTAGKEASGTGNMKLMLNGAPTFGTLDGANIEIINESGNENNFIFGLKVEDIENLKRYYNPWDYYNNNENLKRVINTLVDGTFKDNFNNDYRDLFNSLMHEGDQYLVLADFESFKETENKVFEAYKDRLLWAKKCFLNICNAGKFSSDRTIKQYCDEIWHINKCENIK